MVARENIEMYTLAVKIPHPLLDRLDEKVRQTGDDLDDYVQALLMTDIQSLILSEILAPFRQEVKESGISEDEFTALFEEAREEVWQEKQKASHPLGRPSSRRRG